MSFAYIDSQGREVPIPGPDALRLRIELGAITDSTQFWDAGSDRWAPASEHEIYRQLKREIDSARSGGFTAPPPSAIEPEEPDVVDAPDVADAPRVADETEVVDAPEPPTEPETSPIEPAPEMPRASDAFEPWDDDEFDSDPAGHEIDDILAEGDDGDPSAEDLLYPEGASADEIDMGLEGLTLADLDAPVIVDDEDDATVETGTAAEDGDVADGEAGGFDFGSGDLTLDEPEHEFEDEPDSRVVADVELERTGSTAMPAQEEDDDETPEFGMAFEGGAPDDDFEEDLGTKRAAAPDRAAGEPGDPEPGEASPDASGPGGAAPDDTGDARSGDPYQRVVRERRGPRSKPPRRRGGDGSRWKLVGLVVVAVVVAGAAWFVAGGSDESTGPAEPTLVLPDLPAELQGQLRELARSASVGMVAEFDSLAPLLELDEEPSDRWLSGAYLANASAFSGVSEYWEGVGRVADEMIATEDALWESELDEALDSAALAPGVRSQLRGRALAGWAAAEPDRRAVYDQLRAVVAASLDLHDFLLENEDAITYDPGTGGGAGDPVLEAVPDSPELGEEMWERVGRITVALDELGYLQQVETASLFDRVTGKLVATGIR